MIHHHNALEWENHMEGTTMQGNGGCSASVVEHDNSGEARLVWTSRPMTYKEPRETSQPWGHSIHIDMSLQIYNWRTGERMDRPSCMVATATIKKLHNNY